MICPNYKNKDVFREFNELIEALGGDPMTEEEFKSSTLRNLRTGLNFSAMEKAYELWHKTEGNILPAIDEARRNSELDKKVMLLPPKHLSLKQQEAQRKNLIWHLKNHYRYDVAFNKACAYKILSVQLKLREIRKIKYSNYDHGDYISDEMQKKIDANINKFFSPEEKRLLNIKRPSYIGYGRFVANVSLKKDEDGNLTLLERYIEDLLKILDTYSLDIARSEVKRLGIDTNPDVMLYINPKKLEEIRRQILKKVDYYSKHELNEALDFLQQLENERESNVYVECCIRWMKAGMINLPRDNEKVRKLFDYARRHHVDVLRFKTPYDLLKYQIEHEGYIPRKTGINPSDYNGITFDHEETLSDGRVVQIYNVQDDEVGQQSVCLMLADTNPIKKDLSDVIEFSPWCISTFNYNKDTHKASPTTSAIRYWKRYNYAKKQIAFFCGFPIAFNASDYSTIQWWNMLDLPSLKLSIDNINSRIDARFISTNPDRNAMSDFYDFGPYTIHIYGDSIESVTYASKSRYCAMFSDTSIKVWSNFDASYNNPGTSFIVNSEIFFRGESYRDIRITASIKFPNIDELLKVTIRTSYPGDGYGTYYADIYLPPDGRSQMSYYNMEKSSDLYRALEEGLHKTISYDKDLAISDKAVPESCITFLKHIEQNVLNGILTSDKIKDTWERILKSQDELKTQDELKKQIAHEHTISVDNYQEYISGLNIGGFVQPSLQLADNNYSLAQQEYEISDETIDTLEDLLDQEVSLSMFKVYVNMPVNKDLNKKLKNILKKFHFEVLEQDLYSIFGNAAFELIDFLLKLIYMNEEENQNLIDLPEEFAHAFIKMMGAAYHRQNNRSGNNLVTKEYSELCDLMKGTDFYKYVYELYKDNPAYQYDNGRPAENKIVEEAIGKALAVAIINKYQQRENLNIFKKVFLWFKDLWNRLKTRWFTSNEDITNLQKGLDDIADSILDDTYYTKHLKKLDDTGYKKQEYYKTIKDAIKSKNYIPLRIMQALSDLRCIISGSLAYRLLGDVYRDKIDSLHDIDVMIPSDVHGMNLLMFNPHYNNNVLYTTDQILDIINTNFPQASELLNNIKLDVLNFHLMYAYTINNYHTLIFNAMSCEDESLVQRFMNMTGNFTQRLHNFTDEERSKMYLIDLFFNDDTVPNSTHRDDLYNVTLADYTIPFSAKLKTSRAKDLYDYQRFRPYHRNVRINRGDPTTILYDNEADDYLIRVDDSYDRGIQKCLLICKKLLKKFPNLKVKVISEDLLPDGIKANAFILNGTIYLVDGKVNAEDTIEEFMHAVVYTIAEGNYQLYQEFLEEAKNTFAQLYEKIKNLYTDDKGFTEFDRELELLAKVLAKYVHKKLNTKDAGVKGYVAKVLNFFTKLVQNLYKKNLKLNEITNMTLEELADHISTDNIKIKTLTEDNIRFSLSEQDVIGSLTDRIKVLYDAYNKIQNKTVSGLRILNEIYELYTKIRSNQTYQSVVDFLNYAENRLVSYVKTDEGDITDEKDQYNTRTFYGYLMYQKNQPEPFVNCTPEILVNMYKYGIGFFKDVCDKYLIIGTFDGIDNEIKETIEDDLRRVDGIIKNYIMPLWREAIAIVADREIDKIIDLQVITGNPQDREDMKVVVKDYLHKNAMYGDIKNWLEFLYNFGHSNSPIIKLAFHLIQEAETVAGIEANEINLKLAKLFRDAQTSFHFGGRYRLFGKINPGWQSMFMEFDDDGIPTGYFIRDINYGQYEKDLRQFILELNKLFDDTFGHHYSVDEELGITINSATGEDALDEEWDGNNPPTYVQYLKAIEIFKCQRANRRYTLRYYTERLSRPYRGSFDPDDVDDLSKFGHGLSPRTLAEYNRILSNINYYLNLCTDPITNVVKKEDLTEQEKKNLDSWENELDKLQNPYILKDGSYGLKTGEELQMAFEIKAWNKWVGKQTRTNVDLDGFKQAENEAKQKAAAENNPQILYDFYKYNCDFGINQDFINQTIGMFDRRETRNRFAIHAQMLKDGLFGLLKTIPNNRYKRDLKAFENRPAFWILCKELDQLIEDGKVKQAKEFAEMIDSNFVFEEILYRDEHGFAIDSNGNLVLPQDEKNHKDLLTYREYLINYYADIIINNPNRTLFNLLDETGSPMVFTGNVYEIKDFLRTNMFSYTKTRSTKDGVVIEQSPLSIFVVMKPKNQTFYNHKTGRVENTSEYIPKGRFSSKENISNDESEWIYNPHYDNKAKQAELPKREFYDNSKNFNKITGKYKDLYDALIETMKEMLKKYSTNSTFNYMLPQIESLSTQILSILRRSGFKNTAKAFMDSMSTIEENDENMRSSNYLIPRPDGTVGTDVPLKFIHRLKHPERISSDIVGAVLAFVEMATNYELKIKIQELLELFSYNLDYENRRMLHATEQGDIEPIPAKNQEKSYKEMLDINLYGNQWKSVDSSGNVSDQGRALVFAKKTIRKISRLETVQMLGVNIFSVLVGGADALTRFTKETLNHKYLTVRDALTAIYGVLTRLPAAILNIGNPIPNTKLGALLHHFGIAKNYEAVFSDTRKGRLRRIIGNMLMGPFSMIDWFVNSLLLRAHMNHVRFYNGGEFATGFYTKWQLERMFLEKYGQTLSNKIKGGLTWTMLTTTLWDVYKTKAGVVSIKTYIDRHGNEQSYEPYITKDVLTHIRTKTMQRGALINGMNPDNDIPRWKVNPFSAPIFALRAFILLQWLHYFAGRVENIPRSFEYIDTPTFFLNREHRSKVLVKKNFTSDEKNRRTAWNYETGTPEDQVGVGLYRAAVRLVNVLYRTITFNFNKLKGVLKLSNVEKYAILSAFTYISLTALLGWSWTNFHDYVKQQSINKPQSRELAAPLNLSNPTEWSTFIYDKWIGDNYWLMAADNIMFRTFESNISTASPFLAYDLLTSITALKSGLDNHIAPIQLLADAFGLGGISDEVVLSGKYKYFTKKLRTLYSAIGPMNNLITFFTYNGIESNQRWYLNKFGGLVEFFGYDIDGKLNKNSGKSSNKKNNRGGSVGRGGSSTRGGSRKRGGSNSRI